MKIVLDNGVEFGISQFRVLDVTPNQRVVVTLPSDTSGGQIPTDVINEIAEGLARFFHPAKTLVFLDGIEISVVESHDIH